MQCLKSIPHVAVQFCTAALMLLGAAAAADAAPRLPFKVYIGSVGDYEITKGVNTIKIPDGFKPTGTLPVSAKNTYRIKAGQAIALLYNANGGKDPWTDLHIYKFGKVIRKVDGKEVLMPNYEGVNVEWSENHVRYADEYQISRMFKSRFNPPMAVADFNKTDGAYLFNSRDPVPFSKEKAFVGDVNKVAGKVLTVYYLATPIDAQPLFTIEVDFTDVPSGAPGGSAPAKADKSAGASADVQALRNERAAAQQQAADDRVLSKQAKDDDRAASKEAKALAREEAAAARALKREAAAAARKL
jgi:hypothetical protein